MIEHTEEPVKPVKRRTPVERARDKRIARVRAEVRKAHPGDDVQVVFSWWGAELYVDVFDNTGHLQRYADAIDDLEAALSSPRL